MSELLWKINRLRTMSVGEVLFRGRRAINQRVEQLRLASGWTPIPKGPVTARAHLFGCDADLLVQWSGKYQLEVKKLDAYIEGRIDFFGHTPLDVGKPVAWHRDPVTRIEAPRTFGKALNYRDDKVVGNVKFIWELGRHQHLVPLAVGYAVSGADCYRQAIVEQINGWIDENPYGIGVHWCSALEVALRLISWAVVHSLFALRDGEKGLFSAVGDAKSLGRAIYQQAYFIRYFLSQFSSANNHLIGELTGLLVACQVFDLGSQGRIWAEFARKELEHESKLQVHDDGVDKEQAFYYHLWVLEYFFFAWLVGSRTGLTFSEEFVERLLAMARFLRDVSPEGEEPPQVGDADDGFVTRFEPQWPERPYGELLEAISAFFGDSASQVAEKTFWYGAIGGRTTVKRRVFHLDRSPPLTYRDGGYVILGGNGFHLIFDAGPLGYLGVAAHGHADALSLCLAIDGHWWLVDPGTYAYHSEPEWRSYFRGTAAHNTIRVNQEDQSKIAGAFMWLRKANAWIEEVSESDNIQYVRSAHDGYKHLGITHRRELRLIPDNCELEIVDHLSGSRSGTAEVYFHFAPDVKVKKRIDDSSWVATRKGCTKQLVFYTDPAWKYGIHKGNTNPILGWYSPALEEKMPSCTLRGEAKIWTSLKSVTRIVLE